MFPAEMAAVDAAAPEPVEVLIERAGAAVARHALELLGGRYGRRVAVVAGKGNNGADGRAAARRLAQAGVRVVVHDAADGPAALGTDVDLFIDAAYGTGFHGEYDAPDAGAAAVLAVDIPSGIDGVTGVERGAPARADVTVTFAALKPGLLFGAGPATAGEVVVADIGLDVGDPLVQRVEAADLAAAVPAREAVAHKWKAGCLVLAGSPGMGGAARLAATAAYRGGAGLVRIGTPGSDAPADAPVEAVGIDLATGDWVSAALEAAGRSRAAVIGPGFPPQDEATVRSVIAGLETPVVVDGGGLAAVAGHPELGSASSLVLTPHDGEFARLMGGEGPGADRIDAARRLADRYHAVVVLKGPTTVVADPSGGVRVVTEGDARLATAGTGDVLAGLVGAFIARGAEPFDAAWSAAFVHGRAGRLTPIAGATASDVLDSIGPARLELGA